MRDSRLIQQVLSGDRAAGERLVTEHYPRIYRLMRQLTASVESAEDLTQQTFVKAWQALAAFRGEASLSTWLHRIAVPPPAFESVLQLFPGRDPEEVEKIRAAARARGGKGRRP